jgi:hypothetical protein
MRRKLPDFGKKPPSRWSRWRHSAGKGLTKHQEGLVAAFLLLVGILGLVLVVRVLSVFWQEVLMPEDPEGRVLAWKEDVRRKTGFPEAEYKTAGESLPAVTSPRPEAVWQDLYSRRRAASLLCLEGSFQDGMRFLAKDDPLRDELPKVTAAQHRRALEVLSEILPEEELHLRRRIEALREAGRPEDQAWLQRVAMGVGPDAGDERGASLARRLRAWGDLLPEKFLLTLVVNLHVRLREKIGTGDPYMKLLLYFSFPPACPSGRLYLDSQSLEMRGYG